MKTEEHVEQGWRTTQPKTIYSFLNQCTVLNHDWNIRWSTFLKLLCLFHPHHAKPTIWLQYKRTQNLPQNANVTKTKFCKTKKNMITLTIKEGGPYSSDNGVVHRRDYVPCFVAYSACTWSRGTSTPFAELQRKSIV